MENNVQKLTDAVGKLLTEENKDKSIGEISKELKPNDHDLSSVLNYENVIELVKKTTNSYHHNLLETLAEEIFDNLFNNKNINKIKLKIEKPDVIKNTSSVGIEITKKRK